MPKPSERIYALCLFGGMIVGIKFPDIDQPLRALWFIQHRSMLTHGLLLPGILSLLCCVRERDRLRPFTIGFCATMTAHIVFDLFPRGWSGGALIHVLYGWLSPFFSFLWLLFTALGCLYLAVRLSGALIDLLFVALGMGGVILLTDEPWFWPICTTLGLSGIVWKLDRRLPGILQRDKDLFLHPF